MIKVVEKNILPFIDTGVAHKEPGVGQIGAGVLNAPVEPFQRAFEGFARSLNEEMRDAMNTNQFLQFMDKVRVYDLTQPLEHTHAAVAKLHALGIQYFKRIAGAHMGQGANGQIITTSNHVGTHMDGEIHFHASGRAIGQVPLEEWIGPGVVADISKEVGDYDLYSPEMITKNVEVKKGDILIINTGYHRYAWDQKQSDELRYFVKHPGPGPGLPSSGRST